MTIKQLLKKLFNLEYCPICQKFIRHYLIDLHYSLNHEDIYDKMMRNNKFINYAKRVKKAHKDNPKSFRRVL